jgi:hypothetical protein
MKFRTTFYNFNKIKINLKFKYKALKNYKNIQKKYIKYSSFLFDDSLLKYWIFSNSKQIVITYKSVIANYRFLIYPRYYFGRCLSVFSTITIIFLFLISFLNFFKKSKFDINSKKCTLIIEQLKEFLKRLLIICFFYYTPFVSISNQILSPGLDTLANSIRWDFNIIKALIKIPGFSSYILPVIYSGLSLASSNTFQSLILMAYSYIFFKNGIKFGFGLDVVFNASVAGTFLLINYIIYIFKNAILTSLIDYVSLIFVPDIIRYSKNNTKKLSIIKVHIINMIKSFKVNKTFNNITSLKSFKIINDLSNIKGINVINDLNYIKAFNYINDIYILNTFRVNRFVSDVKDLYDLETLKKIPPINYIDVIENPNIMKSIQSIKTRKAFYNAKILEEVLGKSANFEALMSWMSWKILVYILSPFLSILLVLLLYNCLFYLFTGKNPDMPIITKCAQKNINISEK